MATTDVCSFCALLKLLVHALQRGNPGSYEVGCITRTKKSLSSLEKITIMFVPAEAAPSFEGLPDLRLVGKYRANHLKTARDETGAVIHSQSKLLLGREREF